MSNFTNKTDEEDTERSASVTPSKPTNLERRHFSRNALAGSAVLLSLGNRTAWGQTIDCISVATLNSFDPATGMFASAPPGRPDHNENLAAEIHRISSPPDYLDTDGTFSTCKDPDSIDGICLVMGDCPP